MYPGLSDLQTGLFFVFIECKVSDYTSANPLQIKIETLRQPKSAIHAVLLLTQQISLQLCIVKKSTGLLRHFRHDFYAE